MQANELLCYEIHNLLDVAMPLSYNVFNKI
jgi:hypothetical protein